ncbi:MAG: hypothetical protein GXY36_11855 [Chloroflexi bacterium]|nr:hypothetical protein [Chloroflexota bacterium]
MKLVVLITPQIDKAMAVAEAWEAVGATGVTMLESYGLHHLRERSKSLELSLFVSMASVLHQIEETNQTILSVVEDALVDPLIDAAGHVLGDINTVPNTGVVFVLPVERIVGTDPSKHQKKPR